MHVNFDILRFPMLDPAWKSKMFPALLLGVAGLLIPFVGLFLLWPVSGYGLRIMRETVRGAQPRLPVWDRWGELFKDGGRVFLVNLFYQIPLGVLALILVGLMVGSFSLASSPSPQVQRVGIVAFMGLWMLMSFGMAMFFALTIPATMLANVALSRSVGHNSLRAAFDMGAVWRLARAGLKDYVLAFILWYTLLFGLGTLAGFLIYTGIGLCLLPFVLGPLTYYSSALSGALFGMAYYHTQERFATAGIVM